MRAAAIIVGAGRGRRMAGPVPKQYRPLGGVAVLRHTVEAFRRHPGIGAVCCVIHPDDAALYAAAVAGLALPPPVFGGETRQDSVHRGLLALAAEAPDAVLVHDAVRPFVDADTIDAVLAALDIHAAAITGLPVPDTLKRCADGLVTGTVDRSGVWRAQTPQGFRFAPLLDAHERVRGDPDAGELTDDAMVIERAGARVAMVEGGEDNFKITTERDLVRAEAVLRRRRQEGAPTPA